jgi:hypothetical protein
VGLPTSSYCIPFPTVSKIEKNIEILDRKCKLR